MSMDTSPVYSPRFELDVGGTTYQEAGGIISDIVVETTVEGADLCEFRINKPFDPEHHDFMDFEWDDIEPGTDVDLELGWGGSGTTEPVFTGTIQAYRTEFDTSTGPTLSVTAYGLLHEMMHGDVERSWEDETVSNVAEEVLGDYFSNTDVNGPGIERNLIVQHEENDYRFVRELAADYGFEFYAERDTAYFTPRDSIGGEDPVATITYGSGMDSFTGEISQAEQIESVEVRYWDMSDEKEVVGTASGGGGEGTQVFRVLCDSQEEADQIAESRLSELTMSRARGHGEVDGNPAIVAGTVIELDELGERFSKKYYVSRASHRLTGSGYKTSFEVTEIPE